MHKEYYFEIHGGSKKYWSRIKACNGKIVWVSEMYKSKQSAIRPVLKLIKYIGKKNCSLKIET